MAEGAELGMVGLGVMGRNLLLNMADHGFAVAGYDLDQDKVAALADEGASAKSPVHTAGEAEAFVKLLKKPRVVMMLVPAGKAVDAVIGSLEPFLEKGDLIIDGGNSHFTDTDRRAKALAEKGLNFFGMGVSGGERGARHGPSMMPGGPAEAYERVRPLLEACSGAGGRRALRGPPGPRVGGPLREDGPQRHRVRADAAHRRELRPDAPGRGHRQRPPRRDLRRLERQATSPASWWRSPPRSSRKDDERTGKRMVDVILDVARQKGTGMWTSQDAFTLGVPVPTIDLAVAMRNLSAFEAERKAAAEALEGPEPTYEGDVEALVEQVGEALHAAMIVTYAQGMSQLAHASEHYGYDLDLEVVSRIWRGGCIIRAALLEEMRQAYQAKPGLTNLLLDPGLGQKVASLQGALRQVVQTAAGIGIPAPGFGSALAYFDALRAAHLPANLVQAQRDFFGAHTYERVDDAGTFHTEWED